MEGDGAVATCGVGGFKCRCVSAGSVGVAVPSVAVARGDNLRARSAVVDGEMQGRHTVATRGVGASITRITS